MQTIDAPTVEQTREAVTGSDKPRGIVARVRILLGTFTAALSVILLGGSAAFASTPADATGGAGATFIDSLKTQFLSYVVPAALGLMVAVLGISVLVSWGRKAVKSR